MRYPRLLAVMGLSVVFLLAACGGDDEGDAATTTTTVASADSVQVPDHPFPVPDGATRVIMSEEGFLELGYPSADAERIAAFYEQWTSDEGSWTQQEPNLPIGVIASFLADDQSSIDVLRETPDSETLVILAASE